VSNISIEPPFSTSDHYSVTFNLMLTAVQTTECKEKTERFLWHKTDYPALCNYLYGIDWLYLLSINLTADNIWNAFCDLMDKAVELFVPNRVIHAGQRDCKCYKHYPRNIQRLLTHKLRVWRYHQQQPTRCVAREKYGEISHVCRNAIKNFEISVENKITESNNLGSFYKYVNTRLSCPTGVRTLIAENGDTMTNDADRADILNKFFWPSEHR
jgi:hypothetical protein